MAKCVTTLVRLISGQMYHPGRDILWPSMLLLWSGWPLVRCTPTETACGQVCYYFGQMYPPQLGFGSGCHLVRFLVRLTLVRCTPWQRYLVAKCITTTVRLTSGQMYPLAETSCGKVCNYFSRVDLWLDVPPWQRHLVAKCVTTLVRLISGQMYSQQRHLVAKCVTTLVRLTSG